MPVESMILPEWSEGTRGGIIVDGRRLEHEAVSAVEVEILRSGTWWSVWSAGRPWWKRVLRGFGEVGLLFGLTGVLFVYVHELVAAGAFLASGVLLLVLKRRQERRGLRAVDGERVRVRLQLADGRMVVREFFRAEEAWRAYELALRSMPSSD